MKKKSINLIIGLMSFALLGVMAMQYYFIKESYRLKSQLFDQAVNDALNNVTDKLEKKEAIVFLAQKADKETLKIKQAETTFNKSKQAVKMVNSSSAKGFKDKTKQSESIENSTLAFIRKMKANQLKSDSLFRLRDSLIRNRYPNQLVYSGPVVNEPSQPNNVDFRIDIDEVVDENGMSHRIMRQSVVENPKKPMGLKIMRRGFPVIDSIRQYMVVDPVYGLVLKTIPKPNFLTGISEKELQIASQKIQSEKQLKNVRKYLDAAEKSGNKINLFQDIATELQQVNIPLKKRVQPQTIDSLLAIELANHGIHLNYSYKISNSKEDSVIFIKASQNQPEFTPENTYKTVLFTKDMVRDAGFLTVTFPDKNTLILKNMDAILFSSAGLLLILAGSFAYTISSILRQKKVSEMKTDFINNMTHEFKTPVATIMIASEALKDPIINEDKARVNKLAGIIYDENIRLGNHIERVLNIAKIEKDDLKLEQQQLNLNDLIANVIDSMSLQLQKKDAIVHLNLNAAKANVIGDELHLSNVIYNLVDNANKYSKEQPEITLTTENHHNHVVIKVTDKGIGMSRDQQKKIFEQFYRIPTGNLHDVKGFGLGLSYVSNMVKRMNGSISVKSEKDKGSEFEITFPLT
ncbi:HAMP domain-containing histidine kinase [Pelobium sp.]|nr:HAMP domain-containing sensor histidine kinase [Pelobium sp.]MDA9555650.1 HAMP domain-containing histidine kinase [Pelobium sp.]